MATRLDFQTGFHLHSEIDLGFRMETQMVIHSLMGLCSDSRTDSHLEIVMDFHLDFRMLMVKVMGFRTDFHLETRTPKGLDLETQTEIRCSFHLDSQTVTRTHLGITMGFRTEILTVIPMLMDLNSVTLMETRKDSRMLKGLMMVIRTGIPRDFQMETLMLKEINLGFLMVIRSDFPKDSR